jgi:3-dehydroquinate synthase
MQQVGYFNHISELNLYLNDYTRSFDKSIFIVDTNTKKLCLKKLSVKADLIEIQAGEEFKNLDSLTHIWNELQHFGANRNSLIIALGGGVITDIAGFAAATYMRGISFLYVPTTLLAMADAAHGGKTGIDFNGVKNLIGTFNMQPKIFICPEFLKTLPDRELKSGLAEVIKHYLIYDKIAFNHFIKNTDNSLFLSLIQKAIEIKTHFISIDPFDQKERKALNFGHTIGHGVESLFLKSEHRILHGEAVAIGMICESYISFKRNLISEDDLQSIQNCLLTHFSLPAITTFDEVMKFVKHDKKHTKTINCILLNGIGTYLLDQQIDEDDINSSLNYFNSLVQ